MERLRSICARGLAFAALLAWSGLCTAPAALAEWESSARGGVFFGFYESDPGWAVIAAMMGRLEDSKWSVGGEVEYRQISTNLSHLIDYGERVFEEGGVTEVKSLLIRIASRYDFMPESPIRPYLGLSGGLSFNALEDSTTAAFRDENDELRRVALQNSTPIGFDFVGTVGADVNVPILDGLTAHIEGRISTNTIIVNTLERSTLREGWSTVGGGGVYGGFGYRW